MYNVILHSEFVFLRLKAVLHQKDNEKRLKVTMDVTTIVLLSVPVKSLDELSFSP